MPRVSKQSAEHWLESDIRHGENSYRRGPVRNTTPRSFCEQCARATDYLFDGVVTTKATRYVKLNSGKHKAIGTVDVERDGKVCQQCRPPSNLEILEMIEASKTTATKGKLCPRDSSSNSSAKKAKTTKRRSRSMAPTTG